MAPKPLNRLNRLNKFKNKQTNSWRTRDMFVDIVRNPSINTDNFSEEECLYWLEDRQDQEDSRPVLRELFIELGDYTGYKLAKEYLGGYPHLERLLKCAWFAKCFNKWKEELFINTKAKALEKIVEISQTEGASALAASKYLANGEYLEGLETKRGRPSKEELKGELKRQVEAVSSTNEDFKRMTAFTVVNGGKK